MKEQGRKKVPKKIFSVSHPTRQAIIEELSKSNQTTKNLEDSLEESRYNLYHHLEVLETQGIIEHKIDERVKVYNLRKGVAPIVLEIDALTKNQHSEFKNLLNKILALWKKDKVEDISEIDEVLIVPAYEDS